MWREEDEAGGTAAEALLSEEIVRELVNGVWVTHPKAVSSGGVPDPSMEPDGDVLTVASGAAVWAPGGGSQPWLAIPFSHTDVLNPDFLLLDTGVVIPSGSTILRARAIVTAAFDKLSGSSVAYIFVDADGGSAGGSDLIDNTPSHYAASLPTALIAQVLPSDGAAGFGFPSGSGFAVVAQADLSVMIGDFTEQPTTGAGTLWLEVLAP